MLLHRQQYRLVHPVHKAERGRGVGGGNIPRQTCEHTRRQSLLHERPDLLLQDQYSGSASIIGLEWHNGRERYSQEGMSAVAICLSNGSLQLMKDELDEACMVISTGMQPSAIKWNSSGSVLAVAGVLGGGATSSGQGLAVVQFYSCTGETARPGTTNVIWLAATLNHAQSCHEAILHYVGALASASLARCIAVQYMRAAAWSQSM